MVNSGEYWDITLDIYPLVYTHKNSSNIAIFNGKSTILRAMFNSKLKQIIRGYQLYPDYIPLISDYTVSSAYQTKSDKITQTKQNQTYPLIPFFMPYVDPLSSTHQPLSILFFPCYPI